MISSRIVNLFDKTRWVELEITLDNATLNADINSNEAENLIHELFSVIVDLNKMIRNDDDRKSLFESLLDDHLSKWEISQLFQKDDENTENYED